jgi:hypothetical protein
MSEYEVFAIRYAHNAERRAGENFMGGDLHDGPMPMDYFVFEGRRPAHIVHGHDPLVLKRYPAMLGGPPDIVRLDADPLN